MKFEPAQDTYLEKAKKIEIDSLVEVAKEALDHKIECCMEGRKGVVGKRNKKFRKLK